MAIVIESLGQKIANDPPKEGPRRIPPKEIYSAEEDDLSMGLTLDEIDTIEMWDVSLNALPSAFTTDSEGRKKYTGFVGEKGGIIAGPVDEEAKDKPRRLLKVDNGGIVTGEHVTVFERRR
jgi:hypothetical protein